MSELISRQAEMGETLEYMPSAQPEPCEDAVSRTEILRMINCINDHHAITPYKSVGAITEHLTRIARNLPPVTPEQNLDEWCTDCKEYDKERHCCPRWNKVIRQAIADAQPEQRWIPVTVINQNYIPELKDFPYGGLLFTYRTPKGKLLVREAWVERGRILGKKMNGVPIAYQLKPEPWEGDAE